MSVTTAETRTTVLRNTLGEARFEGDRLVAVSYLLRVPPLWPATSGLPLPPAAMLLDLRAFDLPVEAVPEVLGDLIRFLGAVRSKADELQRAARGTPPIE